MSKSANEAKLEWHLRVATRFVWERDTFKFHPEKKFRADFAIWSCEESRRIGHKPLLIEVDGAKKGKPGAHQRVDGIDYDCRRAAEAVALGYRVLRVSARMVQDGTALTYIERLLAQGEG